jgi:hypothetical protein
MRKWLLWVASLTMLAVFAAPATAAGTKTFVGYITDTSCGLDHGPMQEMASMGKDDRTCTLKCVEKGDEFALADRAAKKVYKLSDQEKPRQFAGTKVKVKGTLEGDTIQVASIEPAE